MAAASALHGGTGQVSRRSDIDGLRAIAVASVILFHVRPDVFPGGFAGVDIFFVISGYLIASNLEARSSQNRFDLLAFYNNRLLRIAPAFLLMSCASLTAALYMLMPGELDDMARSLVSCLLLGPNIYFLTQSGYFDHAALEKPLLHTWTLGVEAQFYLCAPLLFFALGRVPKPFRLTAYAILTASLFAFCTVLQASAPAAAFYLMPTRLWEFVIGGIIASKLLPKIRSRLAADISVLLAFLGLTGFMFAGTSSNYPGLPTLIPVGAAGVLIHMGQSSPIAVSLLSTDSGFDRTYVLFALSLALAAIGLGCLPGPRKDRDASCGRICRSDQLRMAFVEIH